MYVCMCVCMRVCTYIHAYIHKYIYIYEGDPTISDHTKQHCRSKLSMITPEV